MLKIVAPHLNVTADKSILADIRVPENFQEKMTACEDEVPDNFDTGQPTFVGYPDPVIPPDFNPFAKDMNASSAETRPDFVVSPAPSVELDKQGIPWDKRIHTPAKTKMVNGNWKVARNTPPKLVEQVTAELKAVMAIPAPGTVETKATTAIPSPAFAPPPPPPALEVPPTETFMTLINKITAAVTAGKITQAQVIEAVQSVGIPSLPIVATRPDLVPTVGSIIDAMLLVAG